MFSVQVNVGLMPCVRLVYPVEPSLLRNSLTVPCQSVTYCIN